MNLQQIKAAANDLRFEELKQLKGHIDDMLARRAQNGDDWTEAPES